MRRLLIPTLVAVLALAGCAVPSARSTSQANADASATAHTPIHLEGRFAVDYTDQNGTTRNAYGNFDWREEAGTVTLQLRSPLGQTLALIESAPGTATLELPNRPPQTAPNVEELMQRVIGFGLPVDGMRYWIKGHPAPGSHASVENNSDGQISQLRQNDWLIHYVSYTPDQNPQPQRIDLSHEGSGPPIRVKLVFDE
ncbi:MAG: lipoprotein insertase outer membrane protein LolB [Janthinobacterium lividum]